MLDLSKVQVPLGNPTIPGTPIIGEPLEAVAPRFLGGGPIVYEWSGHGLSGPGMPPWSNFLPDPGPSPMYTPSKLDVGKQLTVTVRPGTSISEMGVFGLFSATSAPTAVVLDGPDVKPPDFGLDLMHGHAAGSYVYSPDVADGPIEIRRGDHTVMATGMLVDHHAEVTVPGDAWVAGTYPVRVAFLGDEVINPASSPGSWVKVAKATSAVTTSLRSSVKVSSHASLHVTVKVIGDPNPTGTIKVYDGSHRLITTSLWSSSRGKKAISLPHLKRGNHSIRVVYSGNTSISSSKSRYEHIKAK